MVQEKESETNLIFRCPVVEIMKTSPFNCLCFLHISQTLAFTQFFVLHTNLLGLLPAVSSFFRLLEQKGKLPDVH